ncbi:anhydro-N-acetylmuramic acid kinase [Agriterribacter sp.]|uniref:anhydro-N-acetylmuramic acid kinase n=1 Tax=Agriterribacter sp. TaxID=2821509 RepID=UPI002CA3847A|nr:anhydro-N-acetylmuramic acid kinase [Agriterribacter sp.]HRO44840.1 anhydro-N-acetylmuramic acid kinase [Agriterribacter sp.]HRQ18581.1 anhydro-N-acetylmuramic acid kinase [Agriterribacter sp.]
MIYRAIGLMSGSSLDGLDIAYVHFHENAGTWSFDIEYADCYPYPEEWINKLQSAIQLNALDYQLLHAEYGHFLGEQVNTFINIHQLHYQVQFIASHGHTTFHVPGKKMTAQLGDGAAIAAETGTPVISDLRALDVALGGQGAPIVPVGDKLLFSEYDYCLNIGGIANLSAHSGDTYVSFDICPANRVLNLLAAKAGKAYDEGGQMAASGKVNTTLLDALNSFPFYQAQYPKSLSNDFGNNEVYPLILKEEPHLGNALCTYSEHIALQVKAAVEQIKRNINPGTEPAKMLVTGGGAFNTFLIQSIQDQVKQHNVELLIPDEKTVKYKEALVMALIGVLRWREENNVLSSVTGALRSSIGGAIWMGQEA